MAIQYGISIAQPLCTRVMARPIFSVGLGVYSDSEWDGGGRGRRGEAMKAGGGEEEGEVETNGRRADAIARGRQSLRGLCGSPSAQRVVQ
jgi:hypothetical protein